MAWLAYFSSSETLTCCELATKMGIDIRDKSGIARHEHIWDGLVCEIAVGYGIRDQIKGGLWCVGVWPWRGTGQYLVIGAVSMGEGVMNPLSGRTTLIFLYPPQVEAPLAEYIGRLNTTHTYTP